MFGFSCKTHTISPSLSGPVLREKGKKRKAFCRMSPDHGTLVPEHLRITHPIIDCTK